jgi:hypothetical protein
MWRIEEHRRRVDKQLPAVSREILKRYEKWKDIARFLDHPAPLDHMVSRRGVIRRMERS